MNRELEKLLFLIRDESMNNTKDMEGRLYNIKELVTKALNAEKAERCPEKHDFKFMPSGKTECIKCHKVLECPSPHAGDSTCEGCNEGVSLYSTCTGKLSTSGVEDICLAITAYLRSAFNVYIGSPKDKATITLQGKDIEELAHAIMEDVK
jgi:hypothetical protein